MPLFEENSRVSESAASVKTHPVIHVSDIEPEDEDRRLTIDEMVTKVRMSMSSRGSMRHRLTAVEF